MNAARRVWLPFWLGGVVGAAIAAPATRLSMIPDSEPLEPAAAQRAFEIADDVVIELVAAEPLLVSPVAMAFDARGRLFVVEMPGFPYGSRSGTAPIDGIVVLEDTDGDGRMDRRTVFADGLASPMGVLPRRDGVIVTCAPDVLFLRDTDGDGRADERRVLFTGFSTTQTQALRINSPTLGPDGWIYIASGTSGGTITTPEHPDRPALKMTADVRFHPDTLVIENVDGRTQYGMSFDDAGRRFLCTNRVPVQHVVLASKWLRRNPNLPSTETVQDCSERTLRNVFRSNAAGAGVRLFPLTSHFVNVDAHTGSFTAACAVMAWPGGALPERYRGAVFSCDPTANLVHADRLEPRGATFAAVPMFEGREFLASRDDWFRPVFLCAGPDGALYIADMYRKIIEHADYLPEEIREYADVNAGRDRGRIWRVRSKEKLAVASRPPGRDESWVDVPAPADAAGAARWLRERLDAAQAPESRTRFLAALALGDSPDPRATAALAQLAAQEIDDRWFRAAALSGASGREPALIKATLPRLDPASDGAHEFLTNLGRGLPDLESAAELLGTTATAPEGRAARGLAAAVVAGLTEQKAMRFDPPPRETWIARVLADTARLVVDPTQARAARMSWVRLLGRTSWEFAGKPLATLATGDPDEALRAAAVRALAEFERPEVSRTLLSQVNWAASTPSLRATILGALLPSDAHRQGLLDAIESGAVPRGAISGAPRRQLMNHREASIRQRAQRLWGESASDTRDAFAAAKPALALAGNARRGRDIFRNACAACHRLDLEGYNVGPDLADMRRQAKETILYHIVMPEAEIAPPYVMYSAETKDGRIRSGMLAGESATTITLLGPLAHEDVVRREDLVKLEAAPGSMMPAGLEAAMTRQELADLLAYLRGERE